MRFQTLAALLVSLIAIGCERATQHATEKPLQAESSPAAPSNDHAPVLAELTQALRKFSAEQRRVPASLSELVSAGYLHQLPTAPNGQTFSIDAKQLKVGLK